MLIQIGFDRIDHLVEALEEVLGERFFVKRFGPVFQPLRAIAAAVLRPCEGGRLNSHSVRTCRSSFCQPSGLGLVATKVRKGKTAVVLCRADEEKIEMLPDRQRRVATAVGDEAAEDFAQVRLVDLGVVELDDEDAPRSIARQLKLPDSAIENAIVESLRAQIVFGSSVGEVGRNIDGFGNGLFERLGEHFLEKGALIANGGEDLFARRYLIEFQQSVATRKRSWRAGSVSDRSGG